MPQIHPTAVVDSQAQIAEDAIIGPQCVVAGAVTIGSGTRLISSVHIEGPATIGRDCVVYPFACIGLAPQDRKYDPTTPGAGVTIGDENIFRESTTVHRATGERPTTIGDRNYFMANSHAGHDAVVGNDCTLANGALLGGFVELGDSVVVGGNAAVHQFCRIGRLVMLSGVTAVTQDVPPFCVVYAMRYIGSLNIVGLRRAGYREHLEPLKQAFDLFFLQHHTNTTAAEMIEAQLGSDPLCLEFARFMRGSRRGITAYQQSDYQAPERRERTPSL